ncbi:MAG: hypothetical protein HY517_01975 [Candidatus Aenigmarchaeota archaeon]|nr:hypothetical protein [Candidatus Aenigmarchaeota archaeon]
MRYEHFQPFRTHRLPRPVEFGELVNAYSFVSNTKEVKTRTTHGERTQEYDPTENRADYNQPALQVVFKVPNMHIPVRAIPVRKKDMPNAAWPELYEAIRFYQAPASQRFRNYRKSADKFADDVIELIDRWLSMP